MLGEFVPVLKTGDLEEGQMMGVTVQGEDVLVARVNGELYAVGNLCSHAEGWLDTGDLDPASCQVECPIHGAKFDLKTGKATRLPAFRPVPTYAVRVEGDAILVGPAG